MKKILLVGCGHMGSALLESWSRKKIFKISVIDPITYKSLRRQYSKKIAFYKNISKVKNPKNFDIIIFAVKPQIVAKVFLDFRSINFKKILFVSIIAGKKISFFKANLNNTYQIVRAMPNLPALIAEGATCLYANKLTSIKNRILVKNLFQSVGTVTWLKKESDLDKVTAISGSGPAYFYLFIEYLISESTKLGIKKNIIEKLVYQTALGSINLLVKNKKEAYDLRKGIAVKGGTTEAAINVFIKNNNFKKIIFKALTAAFKRSKELGNK